MSVWTRRLPGIARVFGVCLSASLLVAGCGVFDDEERLEGERIPVRSATDAQTRTPAPIGGAALPAPRENSDWTQTNGTSSHNSGHIAGPASLSRAWRTDVGTGTSSASAITSGPIVMGGTLYAMDAAARLSALDAASGAERWQIDLAPRGEDGEEGFGGGLAGEGGRVFATTGFGEVLAVDAGSGEIEWRTGVGAPFRAAPAVLNGIVVAVTRDNRAFGLDAATGETLWRVQSLASDAGYLGGASPAMIGNLAVIPFASGELVGLENRSGRQVWNAILSGGRRGLARAAISDVTGDPVIVGPFVVAANQAGRMVAIDARSGRRAWTRSIGSVGPIWAAEDSIFVMSDVATLVRLSARDGTTIWETELPAYEDMEDREGPITYSGPVLVEGRVLVTSSEGELLTFDGVEGKPLGRIELSGAARTGPVVAGGTVYVMTDNGDVEALR